MLCLTTGQHRPVILFDYLYLLYTPVYVTDIKSIFPSNLPSSIIIMDQDQPFMHACACLQGCLMINAAIEKLIPFKPVVFHDNYGFPSKNLSTLMPFQTKKKEFEYMKKRVNFARHFRVFLSTTDSMVLGRLTRISITLQVWLVISQGKMLFIHKVQLGLSVGCRHALTLSRGEM